MTKNDSLIVDSLKKEETVLVDVYERYREDFISWLVKKYNCSIDDAIEIYQNSILALCENIKKDEKITLTSSLKTYLFSIGKNKYSEYKRCKDKYENERINLIPEYEELINEEDLLRYEATLINIKECLSLLGEPCKSILDMFYYRKMTHEEISSVMKYKDKDSVKVGKQKCILRLRKLFEETSAKFIHTT